jgi:hypothetical protein
VLLARRKQITVAAFIIVGNEVEDVWSMFLRLSWVKNSLLYCYIHIYLTLSTFNFGKRLTNNKECTNKSTQHENIYREQDGAVDFRYFICFYFLQLTCTKNVFFMNSSIYPLRFFIGTRLV